MENLLKTSTRINILDDDHQKKLKTYQNFDTQSHIDWLETK